MKSQHTKIPAKTPYDFILGPVKIKDGLFMGDQLAAKDIQFIISNKVTHIINTVSKQIPNLWQRFGIQYLSVNWTEKEQNIFDKKNNAVNAIFHFIQEASQQGQSCLVHSINGKSRACTVIVAYMIKKFNWSLDKCLEFINTKKQQLEIRNGFLVQLQELEKRLSQIYNLSANWQQCKSQEDLMLKNTFLNSKALEFHEKTPAKNCKKKVTFAERTNTKMNSSTTSGFGIKNRQKQKDFKPIKSILKGDQTLDNNEDEDQQLKKMKQSNYISNINGTIVHVTVNNFINTQKKLQNPSKTVANTRPFSSDTKQRQKKTEMKTNNKIFPYDNLVSNFKSPYDTKLTNGLTNGLTSGLKGAIGSKLAKKKQQQYKNPVMAYERPQSANIAAQRKKIKNHPKVQKKQEMVITGKKRYPSSNPRQQLYKWK